MIHAIVSTDTDTIQRIEKEFKYRSLALKYLEKCRATGYRGSFDYVTFADEEEALLCERAMRAHKRAVLDELDAQGKL